MAEEPARGALNSDPAKSEAAAKALKANDKSTVLFIVSRRVKFLKPSLTPCSRHKTKGLRAKSSRPATSGRLDQRCVSVKPNSLSMSRFASRGPRLLIRHRKVEAIFPVASSGARHGKSPRLTSPAPMPLVFCHRIHRLLPLSNFKELNANLPTEFVCFFRSCCRRFVMGSASAGDVPAKPQYGRVGIRHRGR